MDIEIIEDAYLVKVLVNVGDTVKVGTPIAIFCEEEHQTKEAGDLKVT